MARIVTAREAAMAIPDHGNVAVGGFCGFGSPDEVLIAIRQRFEETGSPRDITILKGVSVGDRKDRGCNRLAVDGLVGRVISGHVGLEPELSQLISDNKCLAYMLPLGTLTELFRAAASGKPGILTKCGLDTFVDPRLDGGKANDRTLKMGADIVSLETIHGTSCLFYPTIPVHACVIRGTYADEDGNISLENIHQLADKHNLLNSFTLCA